MELVDKLMLVFRIGCSLVWALSALLMMLAVLYGIVRAWHWIRRRI